MKFRVKRLLVICAVMVSPFRVSIVQDIEGIQKELKIEEGQGTGPTPGTVERLDVLTSVTEINIHSGPGCIVGHVAFEQCQTFLSAQEVESVLGSHGCLAFHAQSLPHLDKEFNSFLWVSPKLNSFLEIEFPGGPS